MTSNGDRSPSSGKLLALLKQLFGTAMSCLRTTVFFLFHIDKSSKITRESSELFVGLKDLGIEGDLTSEEEDDASSNLASIVRRKEIEKRSYQRGLRNATDRIARIKHVLERETKKESRDLELFKLCKGD